MASECDPSSDLPLPPVGHFERSMPFRESKGPIGPFKATKIWHDMIEYLKSNVELKRHRHKMRYIDSCFSGADAVDVILYFLLSDKETFSGDLSREKAVKVCQMLVQRKVIGSVIDKPGVNKALIFEDTTSKLFQFLGEHSVEECKVEALAEDDENDCNTTQDVTLSSDKLRLSEAFQPEDEPHIPCSGTSLRPFGELEACTATIERQCAALSIGKSANTVATPRKDVESLTDKEMENTCKEVALTQLTTLVELTFLDGILSEDKRTHHQQQRDHVIISSMADRNWHLLPLNPSRVDAPSDPLLKTAMECIEYLPKGLSLLNEPVFRRKGLEAKLWAKDIIVKHYTSLEVCLVPQRFLELHLAILSLILSNNVDNAVLALQMYAILLPVPVREELYRLLRFMRSLAFDTSLHLDPQVSNEVATLELFTDHIFQHKLVASSVIQKLVQFMMNYVLTVFTVPKDFHQKLSLRMHELKTGKPNLAYEPSYCTRVSKEEFERQSKDCTEESLVKLMNAVLDNTNISLKEKKQRLKQFQKTYPHLYEQHFEGMC